MWETRLLEDIRGHQVTSLISSETSDFGFVNRMVKFRKTLRSLITPPPPLPFLLQTCHIQVKIVLQLVPNMLQIASEDIKQNVCMHVPRLVSRYGLAVRRLAGKQKDLGSIHFSSSFSSLQKLWFMDTVL